MNYTGPYLIPLIFFALSTSLFAQENCEIPEPPELNSVTVSPERSAVVLNWDLSISENTDASVKLYRDFLGKLPDLVSKDRSLVDNKILEDTEQKISQLLQEKKLKD